jgi:hypothetical protein
MRGGSTEEFMSFLQQDSQESSIQIGKSWQGLPLLLLISIGLEDKGRDVNHFIGEVPRRLSAQVGRKVIEVSRNVLCMYILIHEYVEKRLPQVK